MKFNRLFAMTLAAAVLLTGCSNSTVKKESKGDPTDAAAAYEMLSQDMTRWDGSGNLSTAVTASVFTKYDNIPNAVAITGQYMQQAGENGNETFATMAYDYGSNYYTSYTFLGNGVEFAAAMESGSTNPASTEQAQNYGQYVNKATFDANVVFGVPQLFFAADQVQSTTASKDKESGSDLYTFQLEPSTCEAPVIALLEQMQYINTEAVPVTAEVSSMSCTAAYTDDELTGLTYKFSADLTAEGEVMEMNYEFAYTLKASGEDVDFALPNFEYIITDPAAPQELPVVE